MLSNNKWGTQKLKELLEAPQSQLLLNMIGMIWSAFWEPLKSFVSMFAWLFNRPKL